MYERASESKRSDQVPSPAQGVAKGTATESGEREAHSKGREVQAGVRKRKVQGGWSARDEINTRVVCWDRLVGEQKWGQGEIGGVRMRAQDRGSTSSPRPVEVVHESASARPWDRGSAGGRSGVKRMQGGTDRTRWVRTRRVELEAGSLMRTGVGVRNADGEGWRQRQQAGGGGGGGGTASGPIVDPITQTCQLRPRIESQISGVVDKIEGE
ncbi:hypothetical protein B0H13DRAFT_1872927 [Mycena leptocephala]|nr:hypothetical protein B0H13DRAFT_1872927 [Mycena leptocephala]